MKKTLLVFMLAVLLLPIQSLAEGTVKGWFSCPTHQLVCPMGDNTHWDTCLVGIECQPVCGKRLETVHLRCDNGCRKSHDWWVDRADGCSAEGMTDPMNAFFRESCNVHDLCYATPGVARDTCDKMILANMHEQCGSDEDCKIIAIAAYSFLRSRGGDSYDRAQKAAAENCEAPFAVLKRPKEKTHVSSEEWEKRKEYAKSPEKLFTVPLTEEEKQKLHEDIKQLKSKQEQQ